jgi:putative toxin-antitoxin system antitoxin component (TIGR02293 family)
MTQKTKKIRLAVVTAKANQVFESEADAKKWINKKVRSLGGATPKSLIETEQGYDLVIQTLGKIEFGVIS